MRNIEDLSEHYKNEFLEYASYIRMEKHRGSYRMVHIGNFTDSVNFSIHVGIGDFFQNKYGRKITGPEYPTALGHLIAGVLADSPELYELRWMCGNLHWPKT
jgi:hypothetical protein